MGYYPDHVNARRAARKRERYATDPVYRAKRIADSIRWRNTHDRTPTPQWRSAANSANKAAKKYGADGRLTSADVRALWERQPQCVSCGRGRGLDHIKALANGGTNTPDNIQNLCWACNQVKSTWDMTPDQIERPPLDGDSDTCRRGHPRATDTYTYPGTGKRMCRTCHLAAVRRYRDRLKEGAA